MLVHHFSFSNEERHSFSVRMHECRSALIVSLEISAATTLFKLMDVLSEVCRVARITGAFDCVLMCPMMNTVLVDFSSKVEETLVRKSNFRNTEKLLNSRIRYDNCQTVFRRTELLIAE